MPTICAIALNKSTVVLLSKHLGHMWNTFLQAILISVSLTPSNPNDRQTWHVTETLSPIDDLVSSCWSMLFSPQYFQHSDGILLWLMCAITSALSTHKHVNHSNPYGCRVFRAHIRHKIYMLPMLALHSVSPCYSLTSIYMVSHWWFCNTAHSFNNTNP